MNFKDIFNCIIQIFRILKKSKTSLDPNILLRDMDSILTYPTNAAPKKCSAEILEIGEVSLNNPEFSSEI